MLCEQRATYLLDSQLFKTPLVTLSRLSRRWLNHTIGGRVIWTASCRPAMFSKYSHTFTIHTYQFGSARGSLVSMANEAFSFFQLYLASQFAGFACSLITFTMFLPIMPLENWDLIVHMKKRSEERRHNYISIKCVHLWAIHSIKAGKYTM